MKIFLGADHRGFELKEKVKEWLQRQEYVVIDMGAHEIDKDDDYVDYAKIVAASMDVKKDRGILICGSGHGMEMTANRYGGVRAILGFNEEVTKQGREHEDANVLVLPSEHVSDKQALEWVELFLTSSFSGKERYRRRLLKLALLFEDEHEG
jgi:ribose 5-phosphate isomerase B